jgi:hypothetical protein
MNRRDVLAVLGSASFLARAWVAKSAARLVRNPQVAAAVPGISAITGCGSESADAASEVRLPAWLTGTPLLQWIQIPGTAMQSITSSPDYSKIVGAGLAPADGSYGNPQSGIYAYSGGTLKGGSTMLVFGGGGAGAWAGNEIRALDLSVDMPRWRIPVGPSPSSAVWNRFAAGQTSHVYMKDGKPNARHSYWGPQFIDSHGSFANSFFIFMCGQVWETDADMTFPYQQTVDSLDWSGATWRAPGTHPYIPANRTWAGAWTCKHPATEDVYVATHSTVQKWSPSTNAWTKLCDSVPDITHRGMAAVDPSAERILRLGWATGGVGSAFNAHAIDLATGALTIGAVNGPATNRIVFDGYHAVGGGFVYDPGLRAFLLFQGNGSLLKITPSGATDWYVDYLSTTGTPPPVDTSLGMEQLAGRMQHVASLRGVCILFQPGQDAYFIRTAA